MRLLIIGNPRPTHVGHHFFRAACSLGWKVEMMDLNRAYEAPLWTRRICWHFMGHRPVHLRAFSDDVVARCQDFRPDWVLVTGIAPVNSAALLKLSEARFRVVNFLTDDPWNRQHHAPWFLESLKYYGHIFTPRHANEPNLQGHGVSSFSYMPFAYSPEEHYPPNEVSAEEQQKWRNKIVFIGGADADRVAVVRKLIQAGISVALWGGYWKDHKDLADYAHGHADEATSRQIVASAGANLCLVRRANRDGHSMRSYEIPAMGGQLLVEDTPDHRELFGEEAVYFSLERDDLIEQAKRLLALSDLDFFDKRQNISNRVVAKPNCYASRLQAMNQIASGLIF